MVFDLIYYDIMRWKYVDIFSIR